MTTAENISFTTSLYFRYTYNIRTAKESRRAGATEYVTKGERKINVY